MHVLPVNLRNRSSLPRDHVWPIADRLLMEERGRQADLAAMRVAQRSLWSAARRPDPPHLLSGAGAEYRFDARISAMTNLLLAPMRAEPRITSL